MSLVIIENGQIKTSATSPLHDAVNHEGSALVPEESYFNHLGSADDFTETLTGGTGSVTPDTTNHKMGMGTGTPGGGYGAFQTKKTWVLGTKPITCSFLITDSTIGTGAGFNTQIGFADNFDTAAQVAGAGKVIFLRSIADAGAWFAYTGIGTDNQTTVTSVADGDVLSIVATSLKAQFYVNGTLVATHVNYIPTEAMHIGACVYTGGAVTVERTLSVDYFGLKVYK